MGKGVISYYPNTESKPVAPAPPVQQRNPWPVVVLVVAAVVVLYLLADVWGLREPATLIVPTAAPREQPVLPTLVVQVEAVLHLPTNTPYPTPLPTATPGATPDITINWCRGEQPGTQCEVPPLPTPTPELMRDCFTETRPGAWCFWPETTTDARQEVN